MWLAVKASSETAPPAPASEAPLSQRFAFVSMEPTDMQHSVSGTAVRVEIIKYLYYAQDELYICFAQCFQGC